MTHQLSDEDKARCAAQVDYFVELCAQKYQSSPAEIMEAVRWIHARKDWMQRAKQTSLASFMALLVSALALVAWEGLKAMIRGDK